ncbi:hypothetical protein KPH14_009887 [Odynerus spinipes]|uniref:Peptidase A2 domain-containing protein n=1 Tax=Odynerus spinipes TaxID=1348599 RepID=A0AAD9REB8_9HYME|nr:hypothetical protein KPH14_009887 [Odynerus spinipes]
MRHTYRNCGKTKPGMMSTIPAKVIPTKAVASTSTAVSLIDTSQISAVVKHSRARTPLENSSRDYCILITEENKTDYFLEALVDSGSAINLITKSTYLSFFNTYEIMHVKENINYGGINKSSLSINGYIIPKMRLKLLPNNIFLIKFMIVSDDTISYDVLLGREFMIQPGLTVILNRTVQMNYDKHVKEILNIEAIEVNNNLDIVRNRFDASLSDKVKTDLMKMLLDYVNSDYETGKVNYEFCIELLDNSKPFYYSPGRLSRHEKGEMRKIIDCLLKRNIIRPSNSDFSSRWCLILQNYNYKIEHRPADRMHHVDALSRNTLSRY